MTVTFAVARLGLASLLLSVPQALAFGADLEVEVRGVRPGGGEIYAALFDNAETFSLDTEIRATVTETGQLSAGVFTRDQDFPHPPTRTLQTHPDARVLHLRFTDLTPGEFALGVFQDRNGDNKLDATLGRVPTEPWGISNDPRPTDRPVQWDEAKFTVPSEGASIVILLR
jgi:uncharacterized protein (DUF2141 family)